MGIKGLWSLFSPYCEKKSLHELRGETVAVDLSGWVCDSQNVADYHVQPRLYLRNLFFRTSYLLLCDIKPVFVLEGDAPVLKQNVMAQRAVIQFRGAAPRDDTDVLRKPDTGRKRFANVLKECELLLKSMGVQCLKGDGEAEALCAHLNKIGLVDAVISQDSDCFAYGARCVYRNFSIVGSAGGGAHQGSVDCYNADVLRDKKDFGRNKMVALALLCGCDYGPGAVGTSITTSLAFLDTITEDQALNRLLEWVDEPSLYENKKRWLSRPGICGTCGHAGKTHTRTGCPVCVTGKGCTDNGYKEEKSRISRELSLRDKALSAPFPFPDPLIMKEFLRNQPDPPGLREPTQPSLLQFINIMGKKLSWDKRYCVEKFLPLLTKWHLQDNIISHTVKPNRIIKKRVCRGVPCYEVVWQDVDGCYEDLIPDQQLQDVENPETIWTTIERQELILKYYPNIVATYEATIKRPKKQKRKEIQATVVDKPKRKYTRKRKVDLSKNDIDILGDSMTRLQIHNTKDINVSLNLNKSKKEIKNRIKQKKLDSFLRSKMKLDIDNLVDSFRQASLTCNEISFGDLSLNDTSIGDLSNVVSCIVSKKRKSINLLVEDKEIKLSFKNCNNLQCSTPKCKQYSNT